MIQWGITRADSSVIFFFFFYPPPWFTPLYFCWRVFGGLPSWHSFFTVRETVGILLPVFRKRHDTVGYIIQKGLTSRWNEPTETCINDGLDLARFHFSQATETEGLCVAPFITCSFWGFLSRLIYVLWMADHTKVCVWSREQMAMCKLVEWLLVKQRLPWGEDLHQGTVYNILLETKRRDMQRTYWTV